MGPPDNLPGRPGSAYSKSCLYTRMPLSFTALESHEDVPCNRSERSAPSPKWGLAWPSAPIYVVERAPTWLERGQPRPKRPCPQLGRKILWHVDGRFLCPSMVTRDSEDEVAAKCVCGGELQTLGGLIQEDLIEQDSKVRSLAHISAVGMERPTDRGGVSAGAGRPTWSAIRTRLSSIIQSSVIARALLRQALRAWQMLRRRLPMA